MEHGAVTPNGVLPNSFFHPYVRRNAQCCGVEIMIYTVILKSKGVKVINSSKWKCIFLKNYPVTVHLCFLP